MAVPVHLITIVEVYVIMFQALLILLLFLGDYDYVLQLTIKISEIRLRRFGIILTPLSSRKKDNGRVSNLNTNKGDCRVC